MAHEACGRYQRWRRCGKSRIGLEAPAYVVTADVDLFALFQKGEREKQFYDVIIADEAQFFQPEQIDQLRDIVDTYNVPVFCMLWRQTSAQNCCPGQCPVCWKFSGLHHGTENRLQLRQQSHRQCQTGWRRTCYHRRGTGHAGRQRKL